MCFKGTRCDHKLQDPKNIPLTDLTISSLCVYLKSHGWLAVDVLMASKGKEAIEKSCPLGRGLGGARAVASATRWHHWPLRKHLSRWKLNPWSPALTPPLLGRPVFPQRTWGAGASAGAATALLPNAGICPWSPLLAPLVWYSPPERQGRMGQGDDVGQDRVFLALA